MGTAPSRSLVVNGEIADPGSYPFYVAAYNDGIRGTPDYFCGGSLIHSDIILTAAHCQGNFNEGVVVYNPSSQSYSRLVGVDRQAVYPDYHEKQTVANFDVMVLRLKTPVTDVVPVAINSDPNFPTAGVDIANATGFGLTSANGTMSTSLKVASFWTLTGTDCNARFWANLGEHILCVDPVNDGSICQGDSGGPLTVAADTTGNSLTGRNLKAPAIQVGITMFTLDCVADEIPDGFARVSFFSGWIRQQVCLLSRDPPSDCAAILANVTDDTNAINGVEVVLEFRHDYAAAETYFAVRNLVTNKIAFAGPQYIPQPGETALSTFVLQPGNYALEVYDKRGDGMRNPDYVREGFPDGNWTLYVDYGNAGQVELASGGADFESLQTTQFRVDEPPVAPSQPPSSAPTASPVNAAAATATPASLTNGGGPSGSPFEDTDDSSSASSSLWSTVALPFWAMVGTMYLSLGPVGLR